MFLFKGISNFRQTEAIKLDSVDISDLESI